MSRSAPRRLTRPRFVQLGPGLLALGLTSTFLGCSDGTPAPTGSIDPPRRRKAAADREKHRVPVTAPKTRNVSRTRPQGKWKLGRTLNSTITTPVKTR